MRTNIYESYRPLMEDWKDYIGAVKESVKNYSDTEATQLAILLENTKSELEISRGRLSANSVTGINEGTDISMVNTFQSNVFEIITSVMPNLLANDIVSVQPLDRRNGQVFYLKFTYGNDKGAIKAGTDMISPKTGLTGADYSGESVEGEILTVDNGSITANLTYLPIIPGTVKIVDSLGNVMVEGANGALTSPNGANMGSGTIDYATGALSLTGITSQDTTFTAAWHYDLNSFDARVNEVDVRVVSEPVVARPRKLKSIYMFDVGYDLKMSFGLDMDNVIMKATSGEIGYEIDNEIMTDLLRIAGTQSTWNRYPQYKGMEQKEHDLTLIEAINDASNQILGKTKRYEANFVICGRVGATKIESLGKDHFRRISTGGIVGGPHLVGILEDKFRVYKNPFYPDDAVLVGAKGEMFIEAGYVYAPYLPLFASQLLVDADFKAQRGFCTLYAKKAINEFMYHRITILNNEQVMDSI